MRKEAEFYYLCWTITKLIEIIYSTAESLLWPRRLSNHFGNLRYKRTINTIWRLKKGPKLSLIIRWYTGPFKGHSPRAFQRQFMKLYLGKDLLLLYASGRALIWESSDRHFSSWSSKQLCERSRPILSRTWPQFPHLFNTEGSITAGILSSSNILRPTLSTIYLNRRYQTQWQDQRGQEKQTNKQTWHGSLGKRGLLSLFAPKFPVVRINLPKTGACFPVFAFSIIAGYKCLQTPLAQHNFSSLIRLTILPDSFSLRPAGVTQRTTLPTLHLCPQHQEHFFKNSLSPARKPERAASHRHTPQPGLGGSWWGILQLPPHPAPRAWTKRSYLLSGLLIRRCSLKLG